MDSQKLGKIVVAVTLVALVLLVWSSVYLEDQRHTECMNSCGASETGACLTNECPFSKPNYLSWVLGLVSLLIASLTGIGFYLIFAKREVIITEKEYNLAGLSGETKNLFNYIKNSKGGVYQSDIVKEFNLSKVKVTRELDILERRGLIERKRRGMTNIILVK